MVRVTGYGVFAIPNELKYAEGQKVEVSIAWKNIPKEWKTLSSYGIDKSLRFVTNISQLLHAIYVAGNLRVYQIADSSDPVYLSFYGNFDWEDKVIISNVSGIIKTQRSFFKDYNLLYYAINLIENDDLNPFGGTELHNSFAMHFPKGRSKVEFCTIFAHEHLHTWVGGKIHNGPVAIRI